MREFPCGRPSDPLVDHRDFRTLLYVPLVQHAGIPEAGRRQHPTQGQNEALYYLSPDRQADCEFPILNKGNAEKTNAIDRS